jgi:pimeloyl-ACP methyl ester carboxylesterase
MRFGSTQTLVYFFVSVLFLFSNPSSNTAIASAQQQQETAVEPRQQRNSAPTDPIKLVPKKKEPWQDDEDFDSLSIAQSNLQPQAPLVGAADKQPDFTRELIQVHWRFGDPIDLWVMKPAGVEKPPVVLYLYGYPSDTDRFRDDRYCQRITRGGYAAVGFVSALTGHRYHDRPMKEWFVSELQESLVESTHDVQMIINYLSTRGDLDMDRVGMFGQGSGGAIAILAAAVDPRIKTINLIDPWGDWPDWMATSERVPDAERPKYVTPDFQKQIAAFDPVLWLPKLASRPVRIQDVLDDPYTPEICKKKIEAAAPKSVEIVRYDDIQALHVASYDGKAFDWIKEQLKPVLKESVAK